ncbi:N-acyl homoserine lactonase family protein [Nitrospirillum sp. BR 11164]|uniref:AttM family quorum-quenching N-acyl homoserine lactonase n=1 Tax=Nitrospirillum sp. BR 11164 TaxID=3104324 RepID=UPI002AFE16DC|nr:N-acyl homoserine lactonase family protein [Nitrospirillum sp. BR 11164]MEA1650673.1 N-acyl homoserine lactonase family protein [Nitrospirillum sp. BR 11164]
MSDIRLYFFQSGTQRCKAHDIRMNQGDGADYEIPVPWFLLTHPRGNVVLDGGLAAEGLADPRGYWGDTVDVFRPVMTPDQGCVAQLATLGLAPGDIRHVALSHLHSDHTGAIGRFPGATHIVQRREHEYAHAPDWFAAAAYTRRDFDRPGLDWRLLEGDATDGHDVFGDGVLRLVFTPGHSVGHQSFLVTLPHSGAWLLAADAVYTLDHWNERVLPGFLASAVDTVRSVRKLHALAERTGATLVPGHDPEVWPRFRLAPGYYD